MACVCACVRACVRTCVFACVRTCVCVCVRALNVNLLAFRNFENKTSVRARAYVGERARACASVRERSSSFFVSFTQFFPTCGRMP